MQDEGQVGDDSDFSIFKGVRTAPEGFNFCVFGRTDKRYFSGNAWMGLEKMKEGVDWHPIEPPTICKELPKGVGWLHRLVKDND